VLIAIAVGLCLLMPVGYYGYFAWVRHEHFYHGLPSSRWGRAIKPRTALKSAPPSSIPYVDSFLTYLGFRGEPAVLSGDEAAVPVLLDLIWHPDDEISSPAAHALTQTRVPATFRSGDSPRWVEDHAERVEDKIVLVAKNGFVPIPGSDSRRLILMDNKGWFLDKVACWIDSRLTRGWGRNGSFRVERCQAPQPDGAQFIFRYLPPAGERVSGQQAHAVTHGRKWQRFCWDRDIQASEWEEKGLCRIAIGNNAFEVVWPPLDSGERGELP
jgi:hypothetical protein